MRSEANQKYWELWLKNSGEIPPIISEQVQSVDRAIWNWDEYNYDDWGDDRTRRQALFEWEDDRKTWGNIKECIAGWEPVYRNVDQVPGARDFGLVPETVSKNFNSNEKGSGYAIKNITNSDGPYYIDGFYDEFSIETFANAQVSHYEVNEDDGIHNFDDTMEYDFETEFNADFLKHEEGEKQDNDSVLPHNVWWRSQNFPYKKKNTKNYDYYQLGHLNNVNTNVVCVDTNMEIDPGNADGEVWDPDSGLYMVRSGQYWDTISGTVIPKHDYVLLNGKTSLSLYHPYRRNMSPWLIANQYFSSLAGETVYFGGGVPIAKNATEKNSTVVKLKFKVYNSAGGLVSNAQVHYTLSDKQFKKGSVDTSAGGRQLADGTVTSGTIITVPSFATNDSCTLWLNAYAINQSYTVKIDTLSVD